MSMLRLARPLLRLAAPGGACGLSILLYHRVLPQPDPLLPDAVDGERFRSHLAALAAGFNVIPLDEAVALACAHRLPPRAACITFDDGYADNVKVALPLLREADLHATFFIASGFLDGGRMFNDSVIELARRASGPVLDAGPWGIHRVATIGEKRALIADLIERLKYVPLDERMAAVAAMAARAGTFLPDDLMMTSDQLRTLRRAGMGIGAHTVNHPILATLSPTQARREIADGKAQLEDIIGAPVRLFAYPNGKPGRDYGPAHVAIVRELGFEAAVTTAWGRANGDVFQLPRFTPWDAGGWRFAMRLARNQAAPAASV